MCGAVCTPGTFQCSSNGIGQLCGTLGTWVSNNSAVSCNCYVPDRFTTAGTGLVLDTMTGLTWDVSMRAPATWTSASNTCSSAGLRLPAPAEWEGVMLIMQVNQGATDGMGHTTCHMLEVPFDAAAMPTAPSDLGPGGAAGYHFWTGTTETGFPGSVYVEALIGPSPWQTLRTDDVASSPVTHPYRCVK
jgi:hypothetical protein